MRSWDDNFHFHQVVITTSRAIPSCVTHSLNLSSPNESFNSNIISNNDSVSTQLDSMMMIDSNSKKRKRKGSMDVTNFEDDTMMCSFLENLLQPNSNSTLHTAPQANKNKSKRTKRSSTAADMLTVVLPQTPVTSSNSLTRNTTNSLTYCNNSHSQTKYQMSVSYSTSFLK